MIDIVFHSRTMRSLCNSRDKLESMYGPQKARRILQRLAELRAARNLSHFFDQFNTSRWQPLQSSQFFIFTLSQSGIVIEASNPIEVNGEEKMNSWSSITKIRVIDLDRNHDA